MNREKFFKLLFEQGERTCFTVEPKGTRVKKYPSSKDLFFSINALHPTEDLRPTREFHDEKKPRRADVNVVSFRNLLIEIDNMPLNEQIEYVRTKVPVSTIVYSGSKSYHFIISLEQPLKDYAEYMDYSVRLQELISKRDPTSKNPSTLSRVPGALRPDTEKVQELIYVGERVPKEALDKVLPKSSSYGSISRVYEASGESIFYPVDVISAIRSPAKLVARLGGRNAYFHWLGHRLRELPDMDDGSIERKINIAYERLPDTDEFSIEEAYEAARLR